MGSEFLHLDGQMLIGKNFYTRSRGERIGHGLVLSALVFVYFYTRSHGEQILPTIIYAIIS